MRLSWRGANGAALRSFAGLEQALGEDAQCVRFAMNAGMFDEAGSPIGLYVEGGKRLKKLNRNDGPGNFHLKPNGVFIADRKGHVSIVPSEKVAELPKPMWATQSRPMLVITGKLHPRLTANGASQLIRNGVGVASQNVAFFAISEEGVSFGRFARLFRDGLGCDNALFLDGSVSSLWDTGAGRQDAVVELGPMALVLRRAHPAAARQAKFD